ncbi:uncharacterized protein BDR25DRAFT_397205 [Lindgomyces ingoldianus]|uniref:Uncharacterized protein n=1 Tax=Lindgomyces ingoldianus TaxID=673940 RepID=A0ACB6Q8Z7_9PLEO|nr:uncharacterized protein BDR25DRAFT_397205 [Lindgomyces ingoldianus]KAF2463365.1 hypothetical protein BDR25DRAFT_397205 [Lindgomyces ingoldianus]
MKYWTTLHINAHPDHVEESSFVSSNTISNLVISDLTPKLDVTTINVKRRRVDQLTSHDHSPPLSKLPSFTVDIMFRTFLGKSRKRDGFDIIVHSEGREGMKSEARMHSIIISSSVYSTANEVLVSHPQTPNPNPKPQHYGPQSSHLQTLLFDTRSKPYSQLP